MFTDDYFFVEDCATMAIYEQALELLKHYPEAKKMATPNGDGVCLVVLNNDSLAQCSCTLGCPAS